MAQCHARSKRSGRQCRKAAVHGGTVCHIHGGKSLGGAASPTFRTGKYSQCLPVRLAQRYNEACRNPRLLSLRDDLAVCESRLMDLFQRVDTGESGALWKMLGVTLEAFNVALAKNDLADMRTHLATMRQLITQSTDDYAAWAEIQALWDTRCRLTMAELKTLAIAQQMISVEQLMTYMGVITDAIKRCVTEHTDAKSAYAILGDLSAEFRAITTLEAERGA